MKIEYNLTLDEILNCTGGKTVMAGDGTAPLVFNEIFTDSREEFSKHSIFIALKGKTFNGEDFVGAVFKKGAPCAIVSWNFLENYDIGGYSDKIIIAVDDTTDAYGSIAKMYLNRFSLKIKIAITGSCGKTTTKDMVYKILSEKYGAQAVLKNLYNFNNLIGVPKTILELNANHEFLILEIGTNKKGEIKKLSEIISPDIGAIINIGKSHLLEFKDLEGVLEEKSALVSNLKENSYLVLNADDEMLSKKYHTVPGINILSFGFGQKRGADIVCGNIEYKKDHTGLTIGFKGKKYSANVKLKGDHLIYDFLCALLIGYICGAGIDFGIKALENFDLPDGRMQVINDAAKEYVLINDTYNSNPDSLKASLNSINAYYPDKKKILVLGDMLELGDSAGAEHFNAGREVANSADYIFYKGDYYNNVKEGLMEAGFDINKLFLFDDKDIFKEKFLKLDKKNSIVLVKGSRGMKLEKYFDFNA
ncbi:MAG: UDP-N-acetylmuramoyl-tripeptide--D-alanyl-D-alanine ligase [Deltaproteobacteria bacterium]|jgi:UDP-N-acetylmuramoyl-tripeptide--D-alanyl-D-alanine ligase|nr:UDP-N-acetylmuramoyl-tripeptide--D-alanyl-D-alanine ligase [Deltaproteobacteria bacterium]MCL5879531.1 UDP-N-acetylmuramoyl-tripeptide--D-alanyl-D-alanine ligase [Deltaproteobacteria bacterium]MDA8305090.1 UDP-N-acetylmuramoyl-tripeptide--D-alanyl-D-alanine ligase [Deltaproteobacteria bacterium]